jgi:PAS domain S-box-containing protein
MLSKRDDGSRDAPQPDGAEREKGVARRGPLSVLRSDGPGGVAARRLLSAVGLVVLLLGVVLLLLGRRGWVTVDLAVALLVVASLVTLLAAVTWTAVALEAGERERRLAEERLRGSEVRHRRFFELAPFPTWIFDRESLGILAVNQAAVREYGYSREEFMRMTLIDLRPPEEVPDLVADLDHIGSDEPKRRIWRHLRRDGREIEVEITAGSISFGDRPARIVIARDVTAEQRMTQRLQASEQRFRSLAETAGDAIVTADARGDITFLNPAAEALFGLQTSSALGQPVTLLMPDRFHEAHSRGLRRFLDGGEPRVVGRTVELAGRTSAGEEFPIELSLAAWGQGDGAAFTAVIRDITARKRKDEALRRYASELEAANAELDAFAYSVSHDLRAPLRAIDGFSQALLEDYSERLDDVGRDDLARVRAAAQRMAALIDDLLKLARVTRAEMQRVSVDLGRVAEEVVAELREREPSRVVDVEIGCDLGAEGDPRLLRVALHNLIGNAWKYTRPRRRAVVEIGGESVDGITVFRVKDNGVGFDTAYADKLFAPFQRLHGASEFEGSGVGLATVQRILRRHGGRIWAESEVDGGATFFFTLRERG